MQTPRHSMWLTPDLLFESFSDSEGVEFSNYLPLVHAIEKRLLTGLNFTDCTRIVTVQSEKLIFFSRRFVPGDSDEFCRVLSFWHSSKWRSQS